ncbi:MAG: hydrolase [Ardenticatenaceae bacterium]|nr:hydrolase [Ardenticatenaceae bacterium]
MKNTTIALIQTSWPGSRAQMIKTYRELVAEAAQRGAEIVCLQEFSLSPYFASVKDEANTAWAEPVRGGESDAVFGELARQNGVFLLGSIFERAEDNVYWDTATVHNPAGALAGFTRKVHIPQGAGYYEDYYYGGHNAFPVHDVAGVQTAVPTCYDQWFPELSRIYALNGAEFIFYPTAIGSEPDAPELDTAESWQTVMRGQAIANGVFIAAANRVGQEGVTFYGSSFICDPMGRILAQASRDQTEVIVAELDTAVFDQWRYLFPTLHQRRPDAYGRLLDANPARP